MLAAPSLPGILERTKTESGIEYRLNIGPELYWFRGHFPDNPILPGVVQVHWAIHFGADLGYAPEAFTGLARIKFKAIVQAPAILKLELVAKGRELGFTYSASDTLHSTGTIRFGH
jgi:3-hydroxymyristoyl/3-hydroxydecanoyl-(acyl carrier protein) dehydratase